MVGINEACVQRWRLTHALQCMLQLSPPPQQDVSIHSMGNKLFHNNRIHESTERDIHVLYVSFIGNNRKNGNNNDSQPWEQRNEILDPWITDAL